MSAPPKAAIWDAPEHTLAKIAILRAYLQAWFKILGNKVPRDMLYIDGFAGPGSYDNGSDGSPIVAIKAAADARNSSGGQWKAKTIRMVFVESDAARFDLLKSKVASYHQPPGMTVQCINDEFASAFGVIKRQHQDAFVSSLPLFAFLDPFGVKGVPFRCLKEILFSETSEVFMLLDTHGMERVRTAGEKAGYEKILDEVFGGAVWREISFTGDTRLNCRKILDAYRRQLVSSAGAKFTFPFEMRKTNGNVSYHLLFATKHVKGIEKMKEAMRSVDKTFVFIDGRSGQAFLFAPDAPVVIARDAENYFNQQCSGRERGYDDLNSWILQETPYMRPDKILNKIKARQGIEFVTVGGEVVKLSHRAIRWTDVEKIKFRDRLTPPETGLFGQE